MGIMVCWVARDGPYKCMNILLLWAHEACGTVATTACRFLLADKVTG